MHDLTLSHDPSPAREAGSGPYERLVLRNVTVIDGTGAAAQGPVDLIIEGNRIHSVHLVGSPMVMAMTQGRARPQADDRTREIDLRGHFVLPGLFDCHAHIGGAFKAPSLQYIYNLLLGHGVTSIREPGCFVNGLDFTQSEVLRSDANEIVAPRIAPYVGFGQGHTTPIENVHAAVDWLEGAVQRGAQGVKFLGYRDDIYAAAIRWLGERSLGSMTHHSRPVAGSFDALVSARYGLSSVEHWYGLPEAMFTDRRVQHFPLSFNWEDEQERYHQAGRAWLECAPPGSSRWNDVIDELVGLGTALDPTFAIYNGTRDAERVQRSFWYRDYAAPQAWEFWKPSRQSHGSAFYDWGTEREVSWRKVYHRWMDFVMDFHCRGGRVTVGSDAGSFYKRYGFGVIEELEMLREAGMHPLEVIRAATLSSAELLGVDADRGSIAPGKLADLIILEENPLENLKVLYGHGRLLLNEDDELVRRGGVKLTMKDGILYDARELLADVRTEVLAERERRGITQLDPLIY